MISIICPIYNEEKYIAKCIDSILQQDYPRREMEVLFVDGMSDDQTREIVKTYSLQYSFIRLLDNPDRIVPYAMNKGILEARGDIIIRLDAHALYPNNYFSVLVKQLTALHADNVGAVCRTLPANDTSKCKAIAAALSCPFGMGNSYFRVGAKNIMKVDTVPFGCYRKDVFKRVGLYDTDLVRNQDDELNARLLKSGGSIYLLPDLVVDYFARDTLSKTGKMFYQYGLYKPLVNKKLGTPATKRQFFPVLFVLGLIFGAIFSLFSRYLFFVYVFILFVYFVLAISFSVKKSGNFKQIVYQVLSFITIHVCYGWGYLVGLYKILFKKKFFVEINR